MESAVKTFEIERLETLAIKWQKEAEDFLAYLNLNYLDSDKKQQDDKRTYDVSYWTEFINQQRNNNEMHPLALELRNNLLVFNQINNEYAYLKRLNTVMLHIDLLHNSIPYSRYSTYLSLGTEDVELTANDRKATKVLDGALFKLQYVRLDVQQIALTSMVVNQYPKAFSALMDELEDLLTDDDTTESKSADNIPKPHFSWAGHKTDLAELAWVLIKSKRIINRNTGQPITLAGLEGQLGLLFGTAVNIKGLMQARKDSNKAADDGLTFTSTLAELVEEYIAKEK